MVPYALKWTKKTGLYIIVIIRISGISGSKNALMICYEHPIKLYWIQFMYIYILLPTSLIVTKPIISDTVRRKLI